MRLCALECGSRIINVTCFREQGETDVRMQMNLCRANACQSAVKVTQCLLLWPEVTSQRCRVTKRLFPARSLRCRRWTHFGVFSEFRLRCVCGGGNALLCLFKAKVSGGSDRCDVADSTFLHHSHTLTLKGTFLCKTTSFQLVRIEAQ